MTDTDTGQESSGALLWAFVLDGAGGAKALSAEELSQWVPGAGVLWMHVDITSPQVSALLEPLAIDRLATEALLAFETRPRCDPFAGGLSVALRGVNTNPGAEPEDMVALRLWVDADRIVTARRRRVLSAFDLKAALEAGEGPVDAGSFLADLADRLIVRMQGVIDTAEERVGELEEQVVTAKSRAFASDLAELRRETVAIRRHLAPQREALGRMMAARVAWLDDGNRLQLRDVNDRLTRHIEDLDAVRERSAVLQQELSARLQDELNGRMYVLSVVAAIFLPLGFLTGLLGINIGGMPGVENSSAFLIFSVILLAVLVLQLLWLKRKGWF